MIFLRLAVASALAIMAGLAALGYGAVAVALLSSAGAGAALLLAAGQIKPSGPARSGEGVLHALGALPDAIAVSTVRGKILWQNTAFAKLLAPGLASLAEFGAGDAKTAASVHRLFAAARRGEAHAEDITSGAWHGELSLRVSTHGVDSGTSLLIWRAESHATGAGSSGMPQVRPVAASPAKSTFESLLVNAPIAMALMTREGTFETVNRAFSKQFADARAAGSGAAAVTAGRAARPPFAALEARLGEIARSAGSLSSVEASAAFPAAPDTSAHFVLAPTADGQHLVVFAREAAPESSFDEQDAQNQKLQAVGELAGGIAHDFNNLLTAIIGFSDLLLTRLRASDAAFKDVMNIKHNASRAAELVRHILAYSRRQTLRPRVLTLTDVIEDFHASMGRLLGEKVKARIFHGRDLWFVHADESQLFQVIMNLAVNARDAMPDGGELTIRTANVTERESRAQAARGLERGEYVLCEVRDTGTGIKPEHLARIFDPFFSTKEVGKGTGLGLSMVHGIVKQTGGTILVDSETGAGTSFRIYLPRCVEAGNSIEVPKENAAAPGASRDLTGASTVLLVEDEEAVRAFASRALATRGYTVLEASSGAEALEVMEGAAGQIDLVLSDVVMPEMDGPTLLRHLRERKPGIKIVFMSGYAEEAFRKNLGECETFGFLPKPFTLKQLAETVKAAAA